MRDRDSELLEIPGVGARTRIRLVEHFGSVRSVQQADVEALTSVVPRKTAVSIHAYFHPAEGKGAPAVAAAASAFPILQPLVVSGEIEPAG